jgi:hypothetical protein
MHETAPASRARPRGQICFSRARGKKGKFGAIFLI